MATGHLGRDQRKLLAALEYSAEERTKAQKAAELARSVRHRLEHKPTATRQARREAVRQSKSQEMSLRAIARELGMSRDTVGKNARAEGPPTKLLRAKAEALAQVQMAAD